MRMAGGEDQVENDILEGLDVEGLRADLLEYTRQAYLALPAMGHPRVLDIGCGTGQPTIELARLSGEAIVAIDVDGRALAELRRSLARHDLADRVQPLRCSLLRSPFMPASFDILWEEGVLHLLDANKALAECRRLLRPDGFLVAAETITWFERTRELISKHGFELTRCLFMPEGCWWTQYYGPLRERVERVREAIPGGVARQVLQRYEHEIQMVSRDPRAFDCAHYLLRRRGSGRSAT